MGLAKRVAAEMEAEAIADGERDSPYTERVSLHGGTTRSHRT